MKIGQGRKRKKIEYSGIKKTENIDEQNSLSDSNRRG